MLYKYMYKYIPYIYKSYLEYVYNSSKSIYNLNAEQDYCSRISCRMIWNLTRSKYKITNYHKINLICLFL